MENLTALSFDELETMRMNLIEERKGMLEHDCKMSPDSGCQTCEDIMNLNYKIDQVEKAMIKVDNETEYREIPEHPEQL